MFFQFLEAKVAVILVYMDNIIVTGSNEKFIQKLIGDFYDTLSLKDLGDLSYFLGILV